MTSTEKKAFANEAEKALEHEVTEAIMKELFLNLRINPAEAGLARYGMMKYGSAVAQIARAQALGIDPEELRGTPEEYAEYAASLMQVASESGKDVYIISDEA